MMLSKVTNLQVVMTVDFALLFIATFQSYFLRFQRTVENVQEGGFPDSIGSQQSDSVSHCHIKDHILEDGYG